MDATIVETAWFTRQILDAMDDDDYAEFQWHLVRNPSAGDLIPGGGGLRKIRWKAPGRGKRGSFRLIYYWAVSEETILMLYMYPKNEREDLRKDQLRQLVDFVKREYPR